MTSEWLRKHAIATFAASGIWTCGGALAACPPTDYAQAKDESATPTGRLTLRYEYCEAASALKYPMPSSESGLCRARMEKILSALQAAGDDAGALWASQGCVGNGPDLGMWPGQVRK